MNRAINQVEPEPVRGVSDTYSPAISPDGVAALDLNTGNRKTLIRGGTSGTYVTPGYLVYAAGSTLKAVRFDAAKAEVQGEPFTVADHVMTVGGAAQFAVARNGTLLYVPGDEMGSEGGDVARALVWVDRHGSQAQIDAPPRAYNWARLSPDGRKIALDIRDQDQDVWTWDLSRHVLHRITTDPGTDGFPLWTPDGRRLIFESNRAGVFNVFSQAADGSGSAQQLTTARNPVWPSSISPDGRRLVLQEMVPDTGPDLTVLDMNGSTSPLKSLIQTTSAETNGEVSPDGQWIAYQSNRSGTDEIYVRPFPGVQNAEWQVSTGGGRTPAWASNMRELFYLNGEAMTAVPFGTTPTFASGTPIALFDAPHTSARVTRSHDVARDD